MALSSLQLEAFLAVAREKSFSRAARKLGITQSALSQRVANLERELSTALFLRTPTEPRLTQYGSQLLQHALSQENQERQLLNALKGGQSTELGGIIRVGGFSSVMQSALLPSLAPLLRANSNIRLEMSVLETAHISTAFKRGQIEYFLSYQPISGSGIYSRAVGIEENILVAPPSAKYPEIYLDHDENDTTTFDFFKIQKTQSPVVARSFVGNAYALIAAVELGLGMAVVPRHLIKGNTKVRILKGYKALRLKVYFGYYEQAYYTLLQQAVINTIEKALGDFL